MVVDLFFIFVPKVIISEWFCYLQLQSISNKNIFYKLGFALIENIIQQKWSIFWCIERMQT